MKTNLSTSEDISVGNVLSCESEVCVDVGAEELKSLCIPIRSSLQKIEKKGENKDISNKNSHFIEIFPEEISSISSSALKKVLKEEEATLDTWSDAALLYMLHHRELECVEILTFALEENRDSCGSREERVRLLAGAGIAYLTQADRRGSLSNSSSFRSGSSSVVIAETNSYLSLGSGLTVTDEKSLHQHVASDQNEELHTQAEDHFTRASKIDPLFPMTLVGRGMLNMSKSHLERAKFFFETTLKQCGNVLPALLGMACVKYRETDYQGALEIYGRSIALFPQRSGAAARVGFGLACYQLGQVDRARAAFHRARDMDPDNVDAMVGIAILDMSTLDENLSKDYRSRGENAIRLFGIANTKDQYNAMVQNHLANHYFWKWTPVPGFTVKCENGSNIATGSGPVILDSGERIRIGHDFETVILNIFRGDKSLNNIESNSSNADNFTFKMKDIWKMTSADGLKLWKKDYDRVITLAKGAYSSTSVQEIQAESLFMLGRVYHVRGDMENSHKLYDRACKLAPDLTPARFGLAQTLIWDETYDEAAAHLRLVLMASSYATDAHATLGLLEIKAGMDRKEAFGYLRKAIDLDPLNPDLVLLEALALQQNDADYPTSLEKYLKVVKLMENRGDIVPWDVLTNMGVLCHETKKYNDAAEYYGRALCSLDDDANTGDFNLRHEKDEDKFNYKNFITHKENKLFWDYVNGGASFCGYSSNGKTNINIVYNDVTKSSLKIGDHIKVGDNFETDIVGINGDTIELKDAYFDVTIANKQPVNDKERAPMKVYVKRENRRLQNFSAISIAFNLARLHEESGRIVPAVELHKAIVKRHPSYVNSYLRLACIARDCGSLKDCSEWLKCAVAVAPGNPEVLALVGNLHLSLCDWAPAQSVFDQLLQQKVPNVEAYSKLCLGNIYFNNLKTPNKYNKHLQYSGDWYKRILNNDKSNAYAANGLGTVLAEKGELLHAKEAFNRVREISGDTIPDALLNLGHIYLAQKKHPEALQMYESYMDRTKSTDAPITSKSQDEDDAEVLLFIAFTYFDWARQTELFNNVNATPADERYQKCIQYIEFALKKSKKENVVIRYNWCMAKLQAANCVLQKLTRNIRRTAQEVQDALDGLEKSLPMVQTMIQWKAEMKRIPIASSTLTDFVSHCKANIESAKSHLSQELKKESETREMRELQRLETQSQLKEKAMKISIEKELEAREQEERDNKAKQKMLKVSTLLQGWEQEAKLKEEAEIKKKHSKKVIQNTEDYVSGTIATSHKEPFDDSDEEASVNHEKMDLNQDSSVNENKLFISQKRKKMESDLFGESDEDNEESILVKGIEKSPSQFIAAETEKELFGDSSDDSNNELSHLKKKNNTNSGGNNTIKWQPIKKRKIMNEDSE